jgi:pimeloyl-ACP methyl ester carboxylesterase
LKRKKGRTVMNIVRFRPWMLTILIACSFGCGVRSTPSGKSGSQPTATTVLAGASVGDTIYSQPGERISIGSGRLNLYCIGSGSPTVVFDGGWGDWSPSWAIVLPRVAKWTRACSFDRAGYGFSDAGPMPRTSVRNADELHTALHDASLSGPYVLVAHAFGSYNMRAFADRYMRDVGGIVLVDADDSDVEPAKWQARDHRNFRTIIATMRLCQNAVVRGLPLPPLPSPSGVPPGTCADQFFRGLPESRFSNELNSALLHEVQTQSSLYAAAISEMEEMPWDEAYLQQHVTSFGSRPIRVLTTWHFGRPPATPASVHRARLAFEHDSALAQGSWLRLSTNARQVFDYDESGRYIQLDQPHIVLEAIREVLDTMPGSHI